ncbi:O-acetylhomoserine/O-acetylserine sulfhydrylase [Alicyclobacillus hesperidum URH17-3-68]|uniref:low-specificity L-threonine aldolase n=1 Tax=Alicyclobacillus hesperidum TaxID=89784 RepID=UPI000281B635|nr:low-specificity L-threonine aldolase [Alicyclobacillus hesperidum]EJY55439.1 O-acetylhomoserine/O-acetylserine sulfhydrylase [Alicyclobacillus hesperidum URH17-3-68]
MPKRVDLRSDTVTQPTEQMRRLMAKAEVGDDVYGEDPTVRRLEELAADMFGKEAALFVTSGTQGNQVAIAAWAERGDEVIVEAESHVFYYEVAGISVIAGAQPRPIVGQMGAMDPEDVRQAIRKRDIHQPRTGLICVENTHNRAGGTVLPIEILRATASVAREAGVPIHMDGARIFNAVVASGIGERMWANEVDSLQFCLSKGLGAPVGSVVVGPRAMIDRARVWRKRLGGGLRQAGVLAAPCIWALTNMVERLAEDHAHAKVLAERLANMPGIAVNLETVQTNIVLAELTHEDVMAEPFIAELANNGVLATAFGPRTVRFVTHKDVNQADVEMAVDRIRQTILHFGIAQ